MTQSLTISTCHLAGCNYQRSEPTPAQLAFLRMQAGQNKWQVLNWPPCWSIGNLCSGHGQQSTHSHSKGRASAVVGWGGPLSDRHNFAGKTGPIMAAQESLGPAIDESCFFSLHKAPQSLKAHCYCLGCTDLALTLLAICFSMCAYFWISDTAPTD